jgi:hypothetical protein
VGQQPVAALCDAPLSAAAHPVEPGWSVTHTAHSRAEACALRRASVREGLSSGGHGTLRHAVENGYLSRRGGCQNRWHSLVNCDHGDSTTSRIALAPQVEVASSSRHQRDRDGRGYRYQ